MRKHLTKARIEFFAVLLGVAVVMLAAMPAYPGDVFRPIRTQHGTSSAAAIATTNAMQTGIEAVRITCVAACYYALAVTNGTSVSDLETSGVTATNSTTQFLPANTPVTHRIGSGEFVIIVQVSSGGEFAITELSK